LQFFANTSAKFDHNLGADEVIFDNSCVTGLLIENNSHSYQLQRSNNHHADWQIRAYLAIF